MTEREPYVHKRLQRWRTLKDTLARVSVALGGIGVIIAITLIFFYLAYVVIPLFQGAEAHAVATYPTPGGSAAQTVHLAMEEQGEIGVRFTAQGGIVFFDTRDGTVVREHWVTLPENTAVTSFALADPATGIVGFGLSNGQAVVVKHAYRVTFPNNTRRITPVIEYPLGEDPLTIDRQAQPLTDLAIQSDNENATLVAVTQDRRLVLTAITKAVNFLDGTVSLTQQYASLPPPEFVVTAVLMNPEQRNLYIVDVHGTLTFIDISDTDEPEVRQRVQLASDGHAITSIELLSGGISLLAASADGTIAQWFPVRDAQGRPMLRKIREWHTQLHVITRIAPEYFRKGFAASDREGRIGVYHATAHRTILQAQMTPSAIRHLAIGPRANFVLAEDIDERVDFWEVRNEYPEVSWSSLWGKVWYESYEQPEYIWQSSAATDTFEPKLSLVPLSFGTLKAAFYAMLFAIPLSILGAIYAAHFMAPRLRAAVKPSIEVMEALPTVIIGFLAGLWLAPFVERNLPGIVAMLVLVPVVILLSAYVWSRLPQPLRRAAPDGWEAALLIIPIGVTTVLSIAISPWLEQSFFGGDIRQWLTNELGVDFDQRNSIVVGLAMGFAVIPTIFSISEDAIFGVPKHLTDGSLAMGATPWQTLLRVVILTASPGIFSAVMIGFGRAVGETMIVLMATGNTPVMDMSIFQGMRTLSANIAVEMPESEVNSTHFRVLFLAGLVLFTFTFFFNTIAEIVRQRLREKYSSL